MKSRSSRRTPLSTHISCRGPLDSKITAAAIAASRSRGASKFLPVDTSEAIALKHPRYEAEEIPGGVFNAKPAWPEEKVDTISVNHRILTRKGLLRSEGGCLLPAASASRSGTRSRNVSPALRTSQSQTRRRQSPPCTGAPQPSSTVPSELFWTNTATTFGSACFCFRNRFGRGLAGPLSEQERARRQHQLPQPHPCPGLGRFVIPSPKRTCRHRNERSTRSSARPSSATTRGPSNQRTWPHSDSFLS